MGQLHLHIVTYLVAHASVDEDVQVEVLIDKCVVPTEGELRQRRTDVGLIVLVDHTVTIHVLILDITHIGGVLWIVLGRIGAPRLRAVGILHDRVILLQGVHGRAQNILKRLVDSFHLVAVEVVKALTGHRAAHHVGPLAIAGKGRAACQTLQLVLIERDLEIRVP